MRKTRQISIVLSTLLLFVIASRSHAETVEIDFSGWHPDVIVGIIDRFNEEHDDIHVNYIPGNSAELLTRIAGGTPPDVYRVSWAEFGLWIHRGLAMDLTRLIERDRDEVQPEDIWPPAYNAFNINGKQYAIPHHLGGNLTYVNKVRFDAAGVAVPDESWTYENDFADIAGKLSKDRDGDGVIDQWGFANPNHWGFWAGMMASNGSRLIDLNQMMFTIDNDVTRGVMEYIYDLVNIREGAPGPDQRTNAREQWLNGDAGMVLAPGTSEWSVVDYDFTVVPNPLGTAGRVMPGGAQPLAIYPGSDHIEEAWTFIKWVNRSDIQAWITNSLGLFPPSKRSAIPMVESDLIKAFGLQLENQYPYTNVLHSDIVKTFNGQLDMVLKDETSINEAVSTIQHELTVKLNDALKQ